MPQKQQSQTVPQPVRHPFQPIPKPRKHAEPLPLLPSAGRKPEPSSSLSTISLPSTPLVQPGPTCKTDSCKGKLEPDTVMTWCFHCVLLDWKLWGRKGEMKQGQSQEQQKQARKKRKVVSWADEVQVDGERAASCSSFAGSSSTTEDQSTQSESTSTQASSTAAEAVCHLDGSPKLQLGSLKLACPELATIRGWDSDLTELSDSSGSSDSSSETDDDDPSMGSVLPFIPSGADHPPVKPPSQQRSNDLKIRIPSHAGVWCTTPSCRERLPTGYRWKLYVACRLHHHEYQHRRQNIQGRHAHLDADPAVTTTVSPFLSSFLFVGISKGSDAVFCSMISCCARYRWRHRFVSSLVLRQASGRVR